MFKRVESKHKKIPNKDRALAKQLLTAEPGEFKLIIEQLNVDEDYETLDNVCILLENNPALHNKIIDIHDQIEQQIAKDQFEQSGLDQSLCRIL